VAAAAAVPACKTSARLTPFGGGRHAWWRGTLRLRNAYLAAAAACGRRINIAGQRAGDGVSGGAASGSFV